MWLRRAYYHWLLPAALVLPLWLVVGWAVFQAGAWVFLWVLFIAVPSVLVGQLVLTLLVRSRPSVREERAVSWADVAGFTVWHALTIAVGLFSEAWFVPILVAAIAAGIGMFWLSLWQLWRDARESGTRMMLRYSATTPSPGASERTDRADGPRVIVVDESRRGPRGD